MNFRRLSAIIKKEVKHILRDPRSLISAIILPMLLMFMYCESLNLDVDNLSMAVIDRDKTPVSRDFISNFISSGYFRIDLYSGDYKDAQKSLDSGDCIIALVIPSDFSNKIKKGREAACVQILLDGTDPHRSAAASNYANMIAKTFATGIITENNINPGSQAGVTPEIRIWFNPSLRSKNYIIPGVIALIMAILSALLTSTAISKEWENGAMELLISTPVSSFEIILGKFLPYFFIGLLDISILITAGYFIYDVPIKGSLLLLVSVIVLFLSFCIMFGLSLSSLLKSSLASNIVSLLTMFLPTMLLSGFIFFIPGMPKFMQVLSFFVPAKYFILCSRAIYAKGCGFDVLWPNMLILFIFFLFFTLLAVKRFKKKLD